MVKSPFAVATTAGSGMLPVNVHGVGKPVMVSVGGVVFENELEFEEMFRSAESLLSGVEHKPGFQLSHLRH